MTDTRQCTKCAERRPVEDFAKDATKPSGRKSICKPCDRAKAAEYYARNTERKNAARVASAQSHRVRAIEIYGGACIACGSTDQLEFDHVADDGSVHRLTESHHVTLTRISKSGQRLPDVGLRLLCMPCHRGPGVSNHKQRPHDVASAVAATLASLQLGPADYAVSALADCYAREIDCARGDVGVLRELGPKLLAVLDALGASPLARAKLVPKIGGVPHTPERPSKFASFRDAL